MQFSANHTRVTRISLVIVYTLGVSELPQRLILLLSDKEGLERRAAVVEALDITDMPFAPAVVGPAHGFAGIRQVASELPDLLLKHRPHAVHLSLGHADLLRRVEEDGMSYTNERFAEIERYLHQAIDAVVECSMCEFVITTAAPVRDELQDDVRMNDVERLNTVIRSVAASRDVLVDRLDLVISREETPSDMDNSSEAHLAEDGRRFSSVGVRLAARSNCSAITDVLLRAEHPWRQMMRGGMGGGLDGLSRPPHPELS